MVNLTWSNVDVGLSTCINYPNNDVTVADDSGKGKILFIKGLNFFICLGWRILRIVLFSLLGVSVACAAALVAFFVVR